eukprot:CAMPEP_0184478790 /NCGR_PEP_ID=MMETSP0113_2-20130426/719_1 /TAXON_ID=91329 /ORGANISM="Norrisiella sphaerica, Strain BC52" /LENGTH=359 /DNA_ID=CAMNT_0026856693 /DNA_START=119 /DNA_END=1198 /DNA_ORIENTATION=-
MPTSRAKVASGKCEPDLSTTDTEAAILLSMIGEGNPAGDLHEEGSKKGSDTSGEEEENATDAASTLALLEFSPPLKRMKQFDTPEVSKHEDRAEIKLESVAASINSPNFGSSCHQCKSRRSLDDLNWCSNMLAMQHGKKRPVCRKKYCDRCLLKFLGEKPPRQEGKKQRESWVCPACRQICTCAACRRRKQKTGDRISSTSPLSLSSTPASTSRPQKVKPSPLSRSTPKTVPSRSPSVKRKRSESLTEMLLARTAALALKTPQSAPFSSMKAALPMPSLSLGSRAESLTPGAGSVSDSHGQQRVAHITITPFKAQVSQSSTLQSIQEKLRRLSELSNVGDLDLGHANKEETKGVVGISA